MARQVDMRIVFDNCVDGDCHASLWGFSAYLEKYGLLFDTGSNGRVLLKNLSKADIDVTKIKYLFITHDHWDHIGGIDSILELNEQLTIYAPSTLSKNHIRDLNTLAKEVIVIGKQPMHLFGDLYSTGMLGEEDPEHSLVIDGDEPALLTGCGHFGISRIVMIAKEIVGKEIRHVMGGFHLLAEDETVILSEIEMLKSLGVTRALPTHCSGELAIAHFSEAFGASFNKDDVAN